MISDKEIICPINLLNVAHKKKGVTAGIVNAGTPLPMLSAMDAVSEDLIVPTFIGNKIEIQKCADNLKFDISKYEIIHEPDENSTAKVAAKLASKDKIKIIKSLWLIIYSNKDADIYETNLMRRLAGLLYIDNKTMGDIKEKIKQDSK